MRIQHNIMAMNAYRNYNINTKSLSGNLEKLSSGYKINRAGDDAAGLAISEKMRAQITGLDAAQKNVKDGISLVKTAEGAMQEIQDMLNRMDYLATQSANGTYQNEVDRENLNKEVDALKEEINRIADSANFNGIKLLDGSLEEGTTTTEVKNANDWIEQADIVLDGEKGAEGAKGKYTIDFGQVKTASTSDANDVLVTVKIGDQSYDITIADGGDPIGTGLSGAELASAVKDAIEADDGTSNKIGSNLFDVSVNGDKLTLTMQEIPTTDWAQNMEVKVSAKVPAEGEVNQGEQISVTPEETAAVAGKRLYAQAAKTLTDAEVTDGAAMKIGDTVYTFAVGADSKFKDGENVIDLTDMEEGDTDIAKAAADRLALAAVGNENFIVGSNTQGKITFTEREGGVDWSKNDLKGQAAAGDGDWAGLITMGQSEVVSSGTGSPLTLQIGDTSDKFNQMKVKVGDMHTDAMGAGKDVDGNPSSTTIADIDISTQKGAQDAVAVIKNAINYVSSIRGDLGAIQNRLEHTGNNLSVMAENIQDAESTIRDTDVANEMMSYVKNNILVQSAQAMLAQANQVPQGVLQLLG